MDDPMFPVQSSLPVKHGTSSSESFVEMVKTNPVPHIGGGLLLFAFGWFLRGSRKEKKR